MLQRINIVIGSAWIVAGLVGLGLAMPLMANRVGPNPLYGVRFGAAFRSDEAWFAINRFGGQRMALWSLPQILWGIAAYFVPLGDNALWILLLGTAPLLFVMIPVLQTWRFARRYDAATPSPD
jgi:hypothetical protein